jgi:ParB-like chromosome segregation protein Spo0J
MLEIRPIVVNADMIVLGGNMRLKACKEAGLKEVPIIIADNLTEEQQREFLIKDNVGFGDHDWDMLG